MQRPLDAESLRCFERAATLLNFRRAAESVHLSPAAFGERIRRLEEELGAALLERSTRHVALTEAGKRLLGPARRCLEEMDRCRAAIESDGHQRPYTLLVGTRFELGLSWIVPALPELGRARPERTIHLTFGQGPELFGKVLRGEADALVSSARFTFGGLRYAVLHEERYAFVTTKRHLDQCPLASPADLSRHSLIDTDASMPLFRYFLDSTPTPLDWQIGQVEVLGTIAAVRARLLAGGGVAVLPEYFVRADLEGGALVPLFPEIPLGADHFRLLWRENHPRDAELRVLAEELRALPLC